MLQKMCRVEGQGSSPVWAIAGQINHPALEGAPPSSSGVCGLTELAYEESIGHRRSLCCKLLILR